MSDNYLVLDVGTTGIKTLVFDDELHVVAREYETVSKKKPRDGWVEQDPTEILEVSRRLLKKVCMSERIENIAGLGITNQRETTIVWNKRTGEPVYPAIVWEDARAKSLCDKLDEKHGARVRELTGLSIDSYFSATKLKWILDNVETAENLLFGTVDTWLMWNLCEEHPHVTDCTNASRTLLYDIRESKWSPELLEIFGVHEEILPRVFPSQSPFGVLREDAIGAPLPVLAVAGDQQSSLYAAGTEVGTTKVTYGTGAFLMQTLGNSFEIRQPFFTTLAAGKNCSQYALEAKVADCGSRVTDALGNETKLRATLEEIAQEVDASIRLLPLRPRELVIDGGATRDGIMRELQEKISEIKVVQQEPYDGTALGAAKLVKDSLAKI
jgi:glycerol kinase